MNSNLPCSWTDDQIAELKRMHADRMSARAIASEFWTKFRVSLTRSAVCGKLHRLGLRRPVMLRNPSTPKLAPTRRKRRHMEIRPTRKSSRGGVLRMIDMPVVDITIPPDFSADACTLLELTDTSCRWPIGDPATIEFRYCGSPQFDPHPYCLRHARIAYRPVETRRAA